MVESNQHLETDSSKNTIEDYEFIKQIGEGAFGNVYLAKEKDTKQLYAIKALDKDHIIKHNKLQSVHRERDILKMFNKHPYIIKLETTFKVNKYLLSHIQDKQNLYFVFENCGNGTLASKIKE